MKITILTLFKEMFIGPFDHSIIKRAIDKKIVKIDFVNIRDFGIGKHKAVDDKPFGGGAGMILRADVLSNAIEKVKDKKLKKSEQKVYLLSAHGKQFNWKRAKEYSKLKHLILICGHYEGFDERVKNFIDGEISIGDFIVTGGEIPAMLITDSVVRLLPGVIRAGAAISESFFENLEYPHYTQPRTFKNLSVPDVLISGDHKKIEKWKKDQSLKITQKLRPDLIKYSKKDLH
ncbi:MAG TPA: tRNA (guanosine(37)-N1)-methyltransferase TrmD [Patescibacteria group bacterium]|nr:tRNA (guanosine(37)-N1)-methyltransferase TrmD [Patescibacteria group bacterium]